MNDTKQTTTDNMDSVNYTTYASANLWIEVDSDQVFPEDPGQGTPVMVYAMLAGKLQSATITCAMNEGEVGDYRLSEKELLWLERQNERAEAKLAPFWK